MPHRLSNEVQYDAAVLEAEARSNADERNQMPLLPICLRPFQRFEKLPTSQADTRKFFAKYPWARKIPLFGESVEGYGPKCVISLAICYLLCKGIADYIFRLPTYAMLVGRYGITIQRYQRLSPISSMGWSVKALTAMLCDAFACFGYTKRWYMFLSCVFGGVFALMYALLPAKESSADTAVAFIFLSSFGKANVDILSQGHYSRLMRRVPEHGPALVSFIWWFIIFGALIAGAINGPLSDLGKPQVSIFISSGMQFCCCGMFIFNLYGEMPNRISRREDAQLEHDLKLEEEAKSTQNEREPTKTIDGEAGHAIQDAADYDMPGLQKGELTTGTMDGPDDYVVPDPIPCLCGIFEFNKEVVTRNWRIFVYSIVMTFCVVAMTCGNVLATRLGVLIIACSVSTICCGCAFWALPFMIAKANVFLFLIRVMYLQLAGPVDGFFLSDAACNPGGPHFNFTFYSTIAAIIGNFAGMLGIMAFNYIFSQHSYRLTLLITISIKIIGALFDIIMVERWNIAIGIPDHAMFICGSTIVANIVEMLAHMPTTVLISRLCPRGSESLVYALMAGTANMAQAISSSIGSVLMEYRFPVSNRIPCDFSNVTMLLVIGHVICPLLVVPFVFILIPRARICDNIDADGNAIPAEKRVEEGTVAAKFADAPKKTAAGEEEPIACGLADDALRQAAVDSSSVSSREK